MVEALGGYGEFVTKPEDIGAAIDRAMASGKPACVNVMTNTDIGFPNWINLPIEEYKGLLNS